MIKILEKLASHPSLLDYILNHVHWKHKQFAGYVIHSYPGNQFQQGDDPAEQNHSSYVKRIGPSSAVKPAEALVNMLERQVNILKEKHLIIDKYHLNCLAEAALLKKVHWTV